MACVPAGGWGQPCARGESCEEGLECNPHHVCQNTRSGAPYYGSPCVETADCLYNSKLQMQCVDDTVTQIPTQGAHFSRCGCAEERQVCVFDEEPRDGVCDMSKGQTWKPLPPTGGAPGK